MTSLPPVLSKDELLAALRHSGKEVLSGVRALPPERLDDGRYENGWNARQILAHIATIEWTYPRLIEIARGQDATKLGKSEPTPSSRQTGIPTRTARGGILSYNDRQVEQRADASVSDLLDEFARNREATIAAIEAAEDELMQREIRSAGGVTGPLVGVVNAVAVLHVRAHLKDIIGTSG